MLNHARALVARGWRVTLAGYAENALPADLGTNPQVGIHDLTAGGGGRPQAWWRLSKFLHAERTWKLAVVQNPPGFPALWALPWRLRGRAVALDWHNVGASLYRLARPQARFRTKVYALCERLAARRATTHWSVSAALAREAAPSAIVLHDAPSAIFRAAAVKPVDRLEWWRRALPAEPTPDSAAAWVVVPSSWGADEDQDAILRVARQWAVRPAEWGPGIRPVVILATGRGPALAKFAEEAARLPAGPVMVRTLWLPPEAYPVLLAAADAGLCLHHSSSGLDLPMKLADLRGARLRTLVYRYGPVLDEIFNEEEDGNFFGNDAELADGIRNVATGDFSSRPTAFTPTWEAQWNRLLGAWCDGLKTGGVAE